MKQWLKALMALCLMVVFVVSTLFMVPARAATFTIGTISPDTIVNNVNNQVNINGVNFPALAKVKIGSDEAVVTSFSDTLLIVRIPADFDPGDYSVTVTDPADATNTETVANALHVLAPTPTPPVVAPGRPQIVIEYYKISVNIVRFNQDFTLDVSLDNAGGSTARGMQVTFASSQLLMLANGGIIAAGDLGVAGKSHFSQKMTAAVPTTDLTRVSVDMSVSYSDDKGSAYTDKFTLVFPALLFAQTSVTPTPPPASTERAQLVITDYATDVTPLQPGSEFTLTLSVKNVGSLGAKGVTMIAGGGSSSGSGSGTAVPGGINGGNGEFSNFAPVESSNLQSLGDFAPGATREASQKLIVNVSANPGAYPMKFTFSYIDSNGGQVNDDQVITLLIYSLPNVDVAFYQPVGDFYVDQPGMLPLQLTSLGRRTTVLGKMIVSSEGGTVSNGEGLVGSLDPGGYFTLDAMVTPNSPGPLELTITIEYLDDFNQPQTITKTLSINVMDMGPMPTPDMNNPGGDSGFPMTQPTAWQKIWRFILGLFGLDSSAPSTPPINTMPTEAPIMPVPIKGGGGKG